MKLDSILNSAINPIISRDSSATTEKKLYIGTIVIMLVMLIPIFIMNVAIGLGAWVNYIILFFAMPVLSVLLYLANSKNYYSVGILTAAILVFISLTWILNGGANGTIPVMYVVTSLALIGIAKPKYHYAIFLIFFAHLIAMLLLEQFVIGDMIVPYPSPQAHYQDMIFSYGVSMLIVFWILRFYKLAYIAENKELEDQKKELERNISLKNMYFTIMVHDLKGSFNNILGFSELMTNNDNTDTQKDLERLATLTNISASQSYSLLEDIFEWSRIQQDTFVLKHEKIDLGKHVSEVLNKLWLNISKKELDIQNNIALGNWVNSDTYYIDTILRNLLNNAIKFTPKHGTIILNCWDYSQDELGVSVSDTGIGMDEDWVANLFKLEFNSKRDGTEGESSNGIGLKICKELTVKNGSRIFVESTPGKGSTFTFTISKLA